MNYFGALGGSGGTNLLVTPAQHRVCRRRAGDEHAAHVHDLDLRLFYSGNLTKAALSDAPTIVSVDAEPAAGGVVFTARGRRRSGCGDPPGVGHLHDRQRTSWVSLDLEQCVAPLPAVCGTEEDSRLWKGRLAVAPARLEFSSRPSTASAWSSLDDNRGAYYGLAGAATVATTLTLVSPPAGRTFGDKPSITASLSETAGGAAVAGRTVTVAIGGSAQVSTTGADGLVTLDVPLVTAPGSHQIVASFGGDATYLPSSDSEPFVVTKAPASLSAFTQLAVVTGAGATGIVSTLTASLDEKQQPLMQLTVTYTISGPGGTKFFSTITDYLGRATLPPTGLAAGTYTVSASFAGDSTYTAAARTGTLLVSAFSGFFAPVDNAPTVNVVNAGKAIPVKFSLGGYRGLAIFAPGYPQVVATTCGAGLPTDEIETTVTASSSGLQYDASSDRYTLHLEDPEGLGGLSPARVAVRRRQPPRRRLQVLVASR